MVVAAGEVHHLKIQLQKILFKKDRLHHVVLYMGIGFFRDATIFNKELNRKILVKEVVQPKKREGHKGYQSMPRLREQLSMFLRYT